MPTDAILLPLQTYAAQILAYEVDQDAAFLSADIATAIDSLWKDPIIATVMDHSSEFYLMDSASYFFSQVRDTISIASGERVLTPTLVIRSSGSGSRTTSPTSPTS